MKRSHHRCPIPARSRVLTAFIGLVLALLAIPPAETRGESYVTVVPADRDEGEWTIGLSRLARSFDVRGHTYKVRAAPGEEEPVTVTGISLRALLRHATIDPASFGYAEIARPNGSAVLLTRYQVMEPAAFEEGPAIVYPEGEQAGFLRPSAGPDDLNAADHFAAASVTVRLHERGLLDLNANSSHRKPSPRQAVTFEVTASGSAARGLRFEWHFDDGSSAEGSRVAHRFRRAGRYHVVVRAIRDGATVAASRAVLVEVGRLRRDAARGGAAGGSDRHGPAASGAGQGSSGGRTGARATGSARPAPRRDRPRAARRPKHDASTASGRRVAGELLSAASAVPPAAARPAAGGARSGGEPDRGVDVPAWLWGLLGTLALMGLGAYREARAMGGPRT